MAYQEIKGKKNSWIHFDRVDEAAGEYLRTSQKFHPLDIEDVTSDRQRSKIDTYKHYFFLIVVLPYYDEVEKKLRGREVDIFVTQNSLITIAKKPFPFLDEIFRKVERSNKLQKMWLDKGVTFLLYKILASLFRDSTKALDYIGREVSAVEDDVYDNELKSVAHDLAFIRRGVLAARRMLDPQRSTINVLVNLRREFIPEEMSIYFDDIHDHVEKMWVEVENYRETVDGLHLTNESLISQHTNRIIKILTVISVSLMPLTLLSGIYGMNLVRLPYADRPPVVWGMFISAALFISGAITLVYRKGKF
ncbi:MAG: magnesium transporter CorA family protein [Patescibacteria group bacterium]|jgi:magnesium transporter